MKAVRSSVSAFAALAVTVTVLAPIAVSGQDVPAIDLGYAKYQGVFNATRNVTGFLGMRFAEPPLGGLAMPFPCLLLLLRQSVSVSISC